MMAQYYRTKTYAQEGLAIAVQAFMNKNPVSFWVRSGGNLIATSHDRICYMEAEDGSGYCWNIRMSRGGQHFQDFRHAPHPMVWLDL
jgi:hypothetical protein